ncbi:MAG: hypothetical protein ABIK98_15790 [Pseudomonadota bacterium]|nr:hypothetical protein [Bacteroidota bacterium]MBU1578190.1 hypothetical protein [Bacteroidota bacterium]
MKPKEFQDLAAGIVEKNNPFPSELRTAISRSYYAVYNLGIKLLKDMGFTISKKLDVHVFMRRHFKYSGDIELIEAAEKIKHLKNKRQHADYELDRTDVEKQQNAKAHVYSADRVIKTLEKQCSGKNRDQIIKNIKAWREATKQ